MDPLPTSRTRWINALWVVALGVASSVWCLTAAGRLGATFDEPTYVERGLDRWHTGSHAGLLKLGTMPLPVDTTTLPLFVWEQVRGKPFDPVADLDRLLPVARATTLVFWWLLLLYGWKIGRALAGDWGGRLAVLVLACEPNLLAHASLATTDVAVTAFLLGLCYHFRNGRTGPWRWRVLVPAIFYGFAVLAKASGMVFGALCLAAIECERFARAADGSLVTRLRSGFTGVLSRGNVRDAVQIGLIGMAVVFLYCGSDWEPEPSLVSWAHKLPDGTFATTMVWIADHLRVFSNAGVGLARQVKHNVQGHGVYLLGDVEKRAIWYFFPLALSIKLTVPFLASPLVAGSARRRALANWACAAAVALLGFTLVCRVQIGIRLVLPLIALAAVGLSAALVNAWNEMAPGIGRRAFAGLVAAGAVWMAWVPVSVWPNGICHTNELWGGTSTGYTLLSDSNYDWGQGLPELAEWERRHDVDRVDLWYFGADPAAKSARFHLVPLHDLPVDRAVAIGPHARSRYLAVGTTLLYGSYTPQPETQRLLQELRAKQPVGRTATFVIYEIEPSETGIASKEKTGR